MPDRRPADGHLPEESGLGAARIPGLAVRLGDGGAHIDRLTFDTVRGAGGNDHLWGAAGTDRLDGGEDNDRLDGDPPQGDDYYTRRIVLSRDTLRGGPGDDELWDSSGRNTLDGGDGDDHLVGGEYADRLLGGPGADRLEGEGLLYASLYAHRGGFGADFLDGGPGGDTLRGEAGPDAFSEAPAATGSGVSRVRTGWRPLTGRPTGSAAGRGATGCVWTRGTA